VRCGSDIRKRCMAAELDGKGSEGVSPDSFMVVSGCNDDTANPRQVSMCMR